jgi:hypothetical protein
MDTLVQRTVERRWQRADSQVSAIRLHVAAPCKSALGPERRASRSHSSADRSELFVLGLRLHGACGVTVDARHGAEWTASVRQVLRRLTIRTDAMEPSSKQDDRDSSAALVRARGRAHPPTFDRARAT